MTGIEVAITIIGTVAIALSVASLWFAVNGALLGKRRHRQTQVQIYTIVKAFPDVFKTGFVDKMGSEHEDAMLKQYGVRHASEVH